MLNRSRKVAADPGLEKTNKWLYFCTVPVWVYLHALQTRSVEGGLLSLIVSVLTAGEGMRKVVSRLCVEFPGETIVSNNNPGSGLAMEHTQMRE